MLISMRRDGVDQVDGIIRVVPRQQPPVIVHARASAVRNANLGLAMVRWLLRDVTGHYRAQQELSRSREQLKTLASELVQVEQHERRRIAEIIHDQPVQTLALAKMTFSAAARTLPEEQAAKVREGIALIGQAMEELRLMIFELSPPVLYEIGLGPAVEWLAEQFELRHHVPIEVRNNTPAKTLDQDIRVAMFHAVRELLINVIKHARATRVAVTINRCARGVRVNVIDNGAGFREPSNGDGQTGFGLFNLRNRFEHLGGSVRIRSSPSRGACVRLLLPVPGPYPPPPTGYTAE